MSIISTISTKGGYTKLCDAYGILGNLRLSAGERVLHFLCLVTGD